MIVSSNSAYYWLVRYIRAYSLIGQSYRLITGWLQVQVLLGALSLVDGEIE